MATSVNNSCGSIDGAICSICFEKFKTPRYLPCKHSLCHECLSSYIVIMSQCNSKESRLKFHCPLCRDYIPNTCYSNTPEEWARCFPLNHILEKYVCSSGETFCEACLRESEEENATYICFNCNEKLCVVCTKSHNTRS